MDKYEEYEEVYKLINQGYSEEDAEILAEINTDD